MVRKMIESSPGYTRAVYFPFTSVLVHCIVVAACVGVPRLSQIGVAEPKRDPEREEAVRKNEGKSAAGAAGAAKPRGGALALPPLFLIQMSGVTFISPSEVFALTV